MRDELRDALRGDPGVSALVARRVTWTRRAPTDRLPAVVLRLISGVSSYGVRGRVALTPYRVQVDCLGGSERAARTLAAAVSTALDALKTAPLQAFLLDERDDDFSQADGPDPSGASEIFRTIIDVRVWSS